MYFFRRLSPVRGYLDLRRYLLRRKKHELWFLFASVMVTTYLIAALAWDSRVPPAPYKPNIIYVQSWPLNRSKAEVLAQLKIDAAKDAREKAARDKAQAARQAEFKKLSDKVSPWL